ncbi:sugar ABC transporter substrate-binding protein [Calidifontibacter indicus]|uniref:Carbohydrate ABC transporter substrate-binding protein (CUT1 family) n=1 Tax=Calidifontibacter indicus TaxID=419650 RepID=A0A3D9UZJ5_9MICO|nr:extracellular solute-binding protein [Calidifontibacter indicus]REF32035.1 carbohydrate ABC transporter substrate-binding protein (CUT1 family) [Calidifontibacter indicus]
MRGRTPHRRGAAFIAASALVASMGLAACGSDSSSGGTPTLTWYINPDVGNADASKGGQATLAKECADASGGKYKINVQLLPNSASDQRLQLLRRLAAGDSSMDLMSVDPAFSTEFAAAGYYAPVPANLEAQFKEDRVQSSVDASMYKGKLVSVPFWANTQLLWYKKSVAQKAGLDMTKPVTWDQLIEAAKQTKTQIGVQAKLYEGYSVWINALVASAGGKIVDNPGATYQDIKMGLDSAAGKKAAEIIRKVTTSGVAGPAVSSSTETESLGLFDSKSGGFLVNWPYTYGALAATPKNDVGAALYPRVSKDEESKPPYGGIQLAVGKSSKHVDAAYQAAACITNLKHQTDYMVKSGNPASRKAAFDDAEVKKAFPNGIAALIRTNLDNAVPRPLTQYWGDISTALQQRFSPPQSVNDKTPASTQKFVLDVLKGKALL